MNRRIASASRRLNSLRRTMMAVADATDPHGRRLFLFRLNLVTTAQIHLNWHLDQHRARVARTQRDGWYEGTPASHAVTLPTSPLHTQWLSSPLTPWEYQHIVRRGRKPTGLEHNYWDALDRAEHDFLYRESAPCGAD